MHIKEFHNMLEEEKIVEAEAVEAKPVEETAAAPVGDQDAKAKNALTAFILAMIATVIAWIPVASVAGIVISAIAIAKSGKAAGVTRYPHKVFAIVAKIVGIFMLVASIGMTIFYFIELVGLIIAAFAAIAEAASTGIIL